MICHNSEMKKQSGFEVLKAGTQTVGKDYPRPGFLMNADTKMLRNRTAFSGVKV